MAKVTMKIEGLDKLNKKLTQSEAIAKKHVAYMLKNLVDYGAGVAKEALKGGLDMAGLSIKTRVGAEEAMIFTMMPEHRARSIEEGRKPGESIPILQIARWFRGNRYMTGRRFAELPLAKKREIAVVHSSVMARGVQGKRYMQKAADAVEKAAPKEVKIMGRGIETDMSK